MVMSGAEHGVVRIVSQTVAGASFGANLLRPPKIEYPIEGGGSGCRVGRHLCASRGPCRRATELRREKLPLIMRERGKGAVQPQALGPTAQTAHTSGPRFIRYRAAPCPHSSRSRSGRRHAGHRSPDRHSGSSSRPPASPSSRRVPHRFRRHWHREHSALSYSEAHRDPADLGEDGVCGLGPDEGLWIAVMPGAGTRPTDRGAGRRVCAKCPTGRGCAALGHAPGIGVLNATACSDSPSSPTFATRTVLILSRRLP